jgi:hypothetical protein
MKLLGANNNEDQKLDNSTSIEGFKRSLIIDSLELLYHDQTS